MGMMDRLFAFTEWLRSTQLNDFSIWLSTTRPSVWIGDHFWAIPIIQTIHILAIASAFGSVLMINMRILGLNGMSRTMSQTVRRYLPWIWWALLVLILTGIGMITGEPIRSLINPFFWIKMGLVVVVILTSIWFQSSVSRNMATWEITHGGRVAVRLGAAATILLWCAVMFCGRWIAYAPV